MRRLFCVILLSGFLASVSMAQDRSSEPLENLSTQTIEPESLPPKDYLIVLFPIPPGPEGFWIAKKTDGNLDILPFSTLGKDSNKGKEAVTFSLLVENEQQLLRQIEILRRKVSDLETDYDLLAQRYNRLASVSSAIPVAQRTSEDTGGRDMAIQYLLFRRLMETPRPPIQIDMRVEDSSGPVRMRR